MKLNNKDFFPALTGLRAISAWVIFIYHFFPFKNVNNHYTKWISNIVSEFHIGVDIFFVLSGFLITYRYFDNKPINFKKYMVNRIARIYPMYFIITILVFLIFWFKTNAWNLDKTIEVILSLSMTKALFSKYNFAGIPQGWTLTLEEMFYFTAPIYFSLLKKSKLNILILPILIFFLGQLLKTLTNIPSNSIGFLQNNIHLQIVEFFSEIGLALFIKSYNNIILKYFKITYIGLLFILLYLLSASEFRDYFDNNIYALFFLNTLLSVFGIAPLLYGLIFENTIISKFLSLQIMILLGKSSYIFYLIHKGFISIYIDEQITNNKLLLFILLNIISIILFKYVEEPLNIWVKKKYTNQFA